MSIFRMLKNLIAPPQADHIHHQDPSQIEHSIQAHPDLVIIDVRTSEEFNEGHLDRAININIHGAGFVEKIKKYEGSKIVIYCRSGGRSSHAIAAIKDLNFPQIFHLKNGFSSWSNAGKRWSNH